MKKIIFSFVVLSLSFGFFINNSNAGLFDSINSAVGSVSSTVNQVGGVVGGISQTVSDINGIVNQGAGIAATFDDMYDTINGGGVGPDGKFELPESGQFNSIGANESARGFILNVLNFTLQFLGLIAVTVLVYAGFMYVTSLGDDGKIESAKKIIIYSVIGIIVILMSFSLVHTLITKAGVNGNTREGTISSTGTTGTTSGMNGLNGTTGINGLTNINGLNGTTGTAGINGSNSPGGINGSNVSYGLTGSNNSNGINGSSTSNPMAQIEAANQAALAEELFSYDYGPALSGEGIQDFGNASVISPETAAAGIDFQLPVQGTTQFDFGDNSYGLLDSTTNPNATLSHSYEEEGTYLVRGITQTADGSLETFEETIVVGGATALIQTSKPSGIIDESIIFDASSSTVNAGTIDSYKWTCSGGSDCFEPGEGKAANISFSEPGEYVISLTIESSLGITAETSKNISILGNKPLAKFTFASTNNSNKPGEYEFDASNSHNIEGDNSNLSYQWYLDGKNPILPTSSLTYEFLSTGSQTIELEVIQDYNGQTLTSEKTSNLVEVDSVTPVDFNVTQ